MRVLLFIGMADLLLTGLTLFYYNKVFALGKRMGLVLFYVLLSMSIVISRVLPESSPWWLESCIGYVSGCWLAFLFYSFLVSIIHFLFWMCSFCLSKSVPRQVDIVLLTGALFLCLWGVWQTVHPVIRREVIVTPKFTERQSLRLALVSDIHLGRTLGIAHAERVVQLLNSCDPDVIIMAGDLLDERQSYVDKSGALEIFRRLKSRYGSFLIFGNHDYFDRPELWRQKVEQCGIKVLENESCVLTEGVRLVGLKDFSRENGTVFLKRLAEYPETYKVVVDHQPRRIWQAARAGYDLYLAGHTHTGQLFPNRIITRMLYPLDYGRGSFGGMTGIVSSGIGYWGPPVRSSEAPEVVLIEITGQNNNITLSVGK